ncbi:hypothetical protein ACH5RR_006235 [Cinchona calisaya]|uniref:Pentatricopeptide repeat-containing protein n=1 Tax=Cinchona calisaya TaxID=153742 RepID=A0ABD3ANR4_9GENT
MLTVRCARQTRTSSLYYPLPLYLFYSTYSSSAAKQQTHHHHPPLPPASSASPSTPSLPSFFSSETLQASDILLPFKEWFLSRKNPFFDRIFEILRTKDGAAGEAALGRLNLRLSESLVLDVLNYGKSERDLLSCLKFFDWVGRQRGFQHTHATFHAIFSILSKAKLMSLMLEFLENYKKQKYVHQVRFYSTLVIGYSVAGKPEIALQLLGKMRFQGIDLDHFSYHVLLNSLVEHGYFDVVDVITDQIRLRGHENGITHSILVKGFCKQKDLDRAEEYLRRLMVEKVNGKPVVNGVLVATFVDALCKDKQFQRAGVLVEEVKKLGTVPLEPAYGVWIRDLLKAGKLDGALEFLRGKKEVDGYVPDVFRYNTLVSRLLRQNRLEEVFDLLVEMKEQNILPDGVTMNTTLCFFCKAGMLDVAMQLYDSRAEFGLSVNSMAYNYLINSLFGDVSVDEAYYVLRNAIEQGYFPGKKTFSIIADALCREMKLDKMMELVLVALEKNFTLSDSIYDKFISALCRSNKLEDGYLLHGQLNRLNKVAGKNTYCNLISGFYKAGRGDIAASLLLEMQEKGHMPNRKLFRAVICRLCQMDDPEKQFYRLLEIQLSRYEPTCQFYNFFIDGAGHAGKHHLARQVYQMMERSGIAPSLKSDILMLQSYLKNDKISNALNFFRDLSKKREFKRKLWHSMIVGLCKARKPEYALEIFWEMRKKQLKPSIECYEELVKLLCYRREYRVALEVVDDLSRIGRPISSFIGNVLLLHSVNSRELINAWYNSRNLQNLTARSMTLGKLVDTFSDSIRGEEDINKMEELIRQCFPLDLYTHNMLLRRLSMSQINLACEYLHQLYKKGYEPNRWSYDIVVRGLLKLGRHVDARRIMEEMGHKGFDHTEPTRLFV